jgi:type IV pilus assembly protein PilO
MAKQTDPKSKLTPYFEKLEKLTKVQRIAIYVVSLVLILGVSYWFLFRPQYSRIKTLDQQLATAKQQLAKAKKNAQELNDWRTKMKTKETQYRTVMRALPEKEEIPSLLAGVSQAGKDAGLDFLLFKPRPESVKGFYAEIPVDINVSGSYHQVAVFFDKVANLPRIVNLRNIKMTPESRGSQDGSGDLKTVCQAVTYKFVESAEKSDDSSRNSRRRRTKK